MQKDYELIKNFKMSYNVNSKGYYGDFGGHIFQKCSHNIDELKENYIKIMSDDSFQQEFNQLLKDYVGRPSPLYFSKNLSEKYSAKIYLKREDLNHTGAHKINNTIGQIILAKRLKIANYCWNWSRTTWSGYSNSLCFNGFKCIVYMGATDVKRQAPNVARMKMLGADVIPVTSGSSTLKDATNEAMRDWINNPIDTHYIVGSVVGPHPFPDMVARFQSVISKEIKDQFLLVEGRNYQII